MTSTVSESTHGSIHSRLGVKAQPSFASIQSYSRRRQSYTAIDPYAPSIIQAIHNVTHADDTDGSLEDIPEKDSYHQSVYMRPESSLLNLSIKGQRETDYNIRTYIIAFLRESMPRLIYSLLLLRLPSLYFSRVARIFEDADMTLPDIKRMALELASQSQDVHQSLFPSLADKSHPTSPYSKLASSWELFIESLSREWKTLNIVSALLLTAILTILQIDSAASDPLTRYSALSSLICAMMSLLYGCIFIIRFNGMKKAHKAAEWAWEAQRSRTAIWWNVWVMLAMPAVWLSWSMIACNISIMSIVWRSGSTNDGQISQLPPNTAFWPRLVVSLMLALGLIYFMLAIMTLSRYGSTMDNKWHDRVQGWIDRQIFEQPLPEHITSNHRFSNPWNTSVHHLSGKTSWDGNSNISQSFIPPERRSTTSHSNSTSPEIILHRGSNQASEMLRGSSPEDLSGYPPALPTTKILELRYGEYESTPLPLQVRDRNITPEIWEQFSQEASQAWREPYLPDMKETTPQASVLRIISHWNSTTFLPLRVEAILCQEYFTEWPDSPIYSIYLVDQQPLLNRALSHEERFGTVPSGLRRIDILDFSAFTHNWITLFPRRGQGVHFAPTNIAVVYSDSSSNTESMQSHRRHDTPMPYFEDDNEDGEKERGEDDEKEEEVGEEDGEDEDEEDEDEDEDEDNVSGEDDHDDGREAQNRNNELQREEKHEIEHEDVENQINEDVNEEHEQGCTNDENEDRNKNTMDEEEIDDSPSHQELQLIHQLINHHNLIEDTDSRSSINASNFQTQRISTSIRSSVSLEYEPGSIHSISSLSHASPLSPSPPSAASFDNENEEWY